jgi:predicted nucleotidyltransferase
MIIPRSKVSKKILGYFILNPQRRHYINELAGILNLDPKNTYRALMELEKGGILVSEFIGKSRFFKLNKKYPLLSNYKKIFLSTAGIEYQLKNICQSLAGAKEAYIFGSYAKGDMDASSDVDVLVVGEHSSVELQRQLSKIQKETGREINAVSFSLKEFQDKKRKGDPFIKSILNTKHIKLL